MRIDKTTKLGDFFFYVDTFKVEEEKIKTLMDDIHKRHPLPEKMNVSFNDLRFRQLIELQNNIRNYDDLLFISMDVVLGIGKEKALAMPAFDCLRFSLHASDELERITKLFKAIEYKPTADEQRAGIGRLSHGFFGTIDWYARRMRITDHDQVVEMKWVRIYECLKIDYDNNMFERNYRKVIEQKSKRK